MIEINNEVKSSLKAIELEFLSIQLQRNEYAYNYNKLYKLCFGEFSSIDDFEDAKKSFLETTTWRHN